MLSIDWRSPAAYQFAKSIPAAGFAWEYLRRNDGYRREFQAITASSEPESERLEAFVQRWGLRFSNRS
ncbi:MAG: transcriptional regulator domain-containing protein [Agrobacterium albertimagni]